MPKELRLKCQTQIINDNLVDDDDVIKKFLKYDFLRFYIFIYKLKAKQSEDKYMIDLFLFKGHPIYFLDFARDFLAEFHRSCHI